MKKVHVHTLENESVVIDQGVMDSIEGEMLKSIKTCEMLMCIRGASTEGDSWDNESLEANRESKGLYDLGDLANAADQEPGQLFIIREDHWMNMNSHEAQHVPNTCPARWASRTDVRFTSEPQIRYEPSEVTLSALRTSRSGQFEEWNIESGNQPEKCCLTQFVFDDNHSHLQSRSYRSGGTILQIASAPINDCAFVLTNQICEDESAMALDLLNSDYYLESGTVDYKGDIITDEVKGVSERNDVRPRTTPKDKFKLISCLCSARFLLLLELIYGIWPLCYLPNSSGDMKK